MINIDIEQNKQLEEVIFGGTHYNIDFSDEKQKQYAAAFEKISKRLEKVIKEYDDLAADEKATGDVLAKKSIDLIETQRDGSIQFLDLIFGKGEGQKIYEKCGKSTEYLRDKTEELATALSLKRDSERKERLKVIKNKYIHYRRNQR